MPRPASLAEYYRRHRQAFELALELGCTPREAAEELQRQQARAAHRAATARLQARMSGQLLPPIGTDTPNPVSPQQAFANAERLLGEH